MQQLKKDEENEDKIKELEDKWLYQKVYNRRENLHFFGIPESTEDTPEVMRNFLKDWIWKTQRVLNSRGLIE